MNRLSLVVIVGICLATSSQAGVLELRNGDRLSGEFLRVDETNLFWSSPKFGDLTVNKADVADITTSKPLKIHGVRTPCMINGMEEEHLVYICGGEPDARRVPLVSLAVIAPYKNFAQGSYDFSGNIQLSGVYARGNEVRDDWALTSSLELRSHDWRHSARLEYARYSTEKQKPDVRWGGRYAVDWFFRERWFLNNEMRYGADELRAVERYYNLVTGAGYEFWDDGESSLSLTGGLAYLSERYSVPEEPADDFVREEKRTAWRLGADFDYDLPFDVSLFHSNEWVLATGSSGDWQLNSTTGVSTMLVDRLHSEIRIDYNVDNQPQQDTEREDVRLQVGLNYEW